MSSECDNCYARVLSLRNPKVLGDWGMNAYRATAAPDYLRLPFKWDHEAKEAGVRRKVFCLSLGDIWEDHPDLIGPRAVLLNTIRRTEHLDWLLLTKRPENWAKAVDEVIAYTRLEGWPITQDWLQQWRAGRTPANVWAGASVGLQSSVHRVTPLLKIPARVHFLSMEPLLAPVDLGPWTRKHWDAACETFRPSADNPEFCKCGIGERYHVDPLFDRPGGIHWVIIGGESGPNARPCHVEWIRSLIRQCRNAEVAVFVKQLGANPQDVVMAGGPAVHNDRIGWNRMLEDKHGGNPAEWPEDLRIQEFPTPRPI
jgi:protein gp37